MKEFFNLYSDLKSIAKLFLGHKLILFDLGYLMLTQGFF